MSLDLWQGWLGLAVYNVPHRVRKCNFVFVYLAWMATCVCIKVCLVAAGSVGDEAWKQTDR